MKFLLVIAFFVFFQNSLSKHHKKQNYFNKLKNYVMRRKLLMKINKEAEFPENRLLKGDNNPGLSKCIVNINTVGNGPYNKNAETIKGYKDEDTETKLIVERIKLPNNVFI